MFFCGIAVNIYKYVIVYCSQSVKITLMWSVLYEDGGRSN